MIRRLAILGLAAVVSGCAAEGRGEAPQAFACVEILNPVPLPAQIDEASGIAWSRTQPGVIWVTNDGPIDRLFAVDSTGALLAEIPVTLPPSIRRVWDIEDMALGPCEGGDCIYLADVGDNPRFRDSVGVYRSPEPLVTATRMELELFPMIRGEEGRIDVETLLLGEGETVHLLSKGNDEPVSLLRYPGSITETAADPDRIADRIAAARTLQEIHRIGGSSRTLSRQFTGGARIPGTDRWMIRTYGSLAVYEIVDGLLMQIPDTEISLGPLREPQGEAIAVRADGRVVLASEAGPFGGPGGLNFLQCEGLRGP